MYLLLRYNAEFKTRDGRVLNTMDVHMNELAKTGIVNWAQSTIGKPGNLDSRVVSNLRNGEYRFVILLESVEDGKNRCFIAKVDSIFNKNEIISTKETADLNIAEHSIPKEYDFEVSNRQAMRFYLLISSIKQILLSDFSDNIINNDKTEFNLRSQSAVRVINFKEKFDLSSFYAESVYLNEIDDIQEEIALRSSEAIIGNKNAADKQVSQKFTEEKNQAPLLKRDPQQRANALAIADYECEYCNHLHSLDNNYNRHSHLFIGRNGLNYYSEGHHLVPIGAYTEYDVSISPDTSANIVSLCTYCHSLIHHSSGEDRRIMITSLSKNRFERLVKVGLVKEDESITVFNQRLLKYYGVKNS